MSSRQTFGRSRIAATGALGLAVLLAVGGIAQSRATHGTTTPRPPLRAIVHLTTPTHSGGSAGRPVPRVSRDDSRAVARHLAALAWARADAAIIAWSPGSPADRKLAAVLAAIAKTHAHVRAVALLDRPQGNEALQVGMLETSRATAPGYLRGHYPGEQEAWR